MLWRPGARGGRRGRAYARTWLAAASLGPSSAESISFTASSAGLYTLEVQGVRTAARYALTARARRVTAGTAPFGAGPRGFRMGGR